ncbi:hypothetical protein P7K49_026651, partial [Saguinus oedipus]
MSPGAQRPLAKPARDPSPFSGGAMASSLRGSQVPSPSPSRAVRRGPAPSQSPRAPRPRAALTGLQHMRASVSGSLTRPRRGPLADP